MSDKYVNPLSAAKLIALVKSAVSGKLDKTGGTITGFLRLKDALYTDGSITSDGNLIGKMLQLHTAQSTDDNPVVVDIAPSADDAAALDVVATAESGGLKQGSIIVATPTDSQANYAATVEYVRSKVEDVDAELSDTSEKPVQNKAIKVAIDKKLDKRGGTITGGLNVNDGVSVGTGERVHITKAADDAARLTHGAADVDDNVPAARLKVAAPTEDDDAATKQYVDSKASGTGAVRYDAAQGLTAAQQKQARENVDAVGKENPNFAGYVTLTPAGGSTGTGICLSPSGSGGNYMLDISDVNEGNPTHLTGVATPTDAQTDHAANVSYVKAKIAEVAASGGVDVDNALSTTSENPVQNKVVALALVSKAGTAVATQSANGLMAKSDKAKLDGISAGANKTVVDAELDASSTNPVQNKVIKAALDALPTGSSVTVDAALSATSTNPVQNKAVKAALDAKADASALDSKADKTALDAKADASALAGKMDKSGGTFTGNVSGKYFTGTWLQTTAATDLGRAPGKIAVLDESGWVYYRTPAELKSDIGASSGGADVSTVLDKVYPVGAIYISVNSTNPKTLFGGTWVQIKDRFLLAAGTTYKAGTTGGEATHTLTTSEMPSHNHAVYFPNAGAADHSAPGNYPDGPSDSTYYAVGSYTSSVGNGGAHNNMPPYLSVYVWKRTA